MKQQRISVAELACKLHIHRQTMYDLLSRDNIDVKRLVQISQLLQHDFYTDLFKKEMM